MIGPCFFEKKQPGLYHTFGALLHHAANIFAYGTMKDDAKGGKCMISTG
jgi:hypothetical protein